MRRFRLVVALDDSEYAEIVLEHAIDQAVRHEEADVHLLRVVDRERDIERAAGELARQAADAFDDYPGATDSYRVRLHVRVGDAVEEIVRLTGELDADLLVTGRFGMHRRRHTLATAVVKDSPCPVLVVGMPEHEVDAVAQCPKCMAVREATDAETLFCSEHSGDPRLHSSALLPWSSGLSHGRLW